MLSNTHKRRLLYISLFMLASIIVVALVLFALRQNINLFYTPQKLLAANLPVATRVRVGGMVVQHSVQHAADLKVHFQITDNKQTLDILYQGILPDLFREGQAVVALGSLDLNNQFRADQILAKHDENYKPPELADVS